MSLLPGRWDIWSTHVAEVQGDVLAPSSERRLLALIARPFEWRREHVYTYADPFMLVASGRLWLFVERQSRGKKGVICAYSSHDLVNWVDHETVLEEPFHVSYPQIVGTAGAYWMLPETAGSGSVWLYRAQCLPGPWTRHCQLIAAPLADPTLLQSDNHWYLWATDAAGALRLFHSSTISGPYGEHPSSPVTSDPRYARCGGRPMKHGDGFWLRLAQDGSSGYGRSLHAMRVVELTPDCYREVLWRADIIRRSFSWNQAGSHHLEVVEYQGRRIRAVDGKRLEALTNIFARIFWRIMCRFAQWIRLA